MDKHLTLDKLEPSEKEFTILNSVKEDEEDHNHVKMMVIGFHEGEKVKVIKNRPLGKLMVIEMVNDNRKFVIHKDLAEKVNISLDK